MATATELCNQANENYVSENYQKAVELYTEALALDPSRDDIFCHRAQAYLQLGKHGDAAKDCDKAIELNNNNEKAYKKKGLALFQMDEIGKALDVFQEGHKRFETDPTYEDWVKKCEEKLGKNSAAQKSSAPTASPSTIKYDWYQTHTHIVITVLVKNVKKEHLDVNAEERSLAVSIQDPSGTPLSLDLVLAHKTDPQQASVKVYGTKIEIKLKKGEGFQWKKLEGDADEAAEVLPLAAGTKEFKLKLRARKQSIKKGIGEETKQEGEIKKKDNSCIRSLPKYKNGPYQKRIALHTKQGTLEQFRNKEKLRSSLHNANLSGEKLERRRELARKRMQAWRDRQKDKNDTGKTRQTVSKMKEIEIKKNRNTERMRNKRQSLTEEQKQAINAERRRKYKEKKIQITTETKDTQTETIETETKTTQTETNDTQTVNDANTTHKKKRRSSRVSPYKTPAGIVQNPCNNHFNSDNTGGEKNTSVYVVLKEEETAEVVQNLHYDYSNRNGSDNSMGGDGDEDDRDKGKEKSPSPYKIGDFILARVHGEKAEACDYAAEVAVIYPDGAVGGRFLEKVPAPEVKEAPSYPSSSHYTRDWDKLAAEVSEEEKNEKLEGDAALNQFFQKIYADASDETKRAMMKSFSESGGTVLSTNWSEVGKQKVDVKPPDGMEFKKWEY